MPVSVGVVEVPVSAGVVDVPVSVGVVEVPAARATLERSTGEVIRRGDRKLETSHLLLALLRDDDSRALELLTSLGVSRDDVEQVVDAQR